MHRVTHSVDGLDVYTVGPFSLHAAEHGTLLWMVKAGEMVLGSVRLTSDRRQVAELTDLVLHATDERTQQSHSAKLMCAVAEYARDHGILKLVVSEDSRRSWLPQQLSRLGFRDAARNSDEDMEFYLDLYHRPNRKRDRAVQAAGAEYSMSC